MADTSDFYNGLCVEFNQDLYTIVSFQHVKPGKGGAFVRTKLKSLTSGRVIENTFTAGVKITTARIERRKCEYHFKDATHYYFMDKQSYETIAVPAELVTGASFLKPGQEADVLVHQEADKILGCELPPSVSLTVTQTGGGAKGNTVGKTYKPAELETGVTVQVPTFIVTGEVVDIDTRTGECIGRAKQQQE